MTVRRATVHDLAAVLALLESAGLPTRALVDCIETCFVAVDTDGVIVAAAGLEPYGDLALVRSVVVREDRRGSYAGEAVTRATLDFARELGMRALYLFTMRASGFFTRFGFVPNPHRTWPEAMRACSQYALADETDPGNERMIAMAMEPIL